MTKICFVLRRFLARRVDGLFIVPAYRLARDGRIYQELAARTTPTVIMGHITDFCAGFVEELSVDPDFQTHDESSPARPAGRIWAGNRRRVAWKCNAGPGRAEPERRNGGRPARAHR